ncbi:MAG: MoaD/ThiS family protein [Phycisphaerales bacterium]|nr:MoaD/ThiS family protein [Phycisphaerales bacterium]
MQIDVAIPAMLAVSIEARHVAIEAATLAEAMAKMAAHPKLGPLAFDPSGELRRHVLLFYNDTSTRHLKSLDLPLQAGDRLAIVQAVSGG